MRTRGPHALVFNRRAGGLGGPDSPVATVRPVPRHWLWMQVAIVVFVIAGMVIAIIRLA